MELLGVVLSRLGLKVGVLDVQFELVHHLLQLHLLQLQSCNFGIEDV